MMKPKPKPSSRTSHIAAGRKASLVWFEPDQRQMIERAAKAEQRPVSQFVAYHATLAAKKILDKIEGA